MILLSFFDGISCGKVALEQIGINIEKYYASEIDKYAIEISQKNHPDIIQMGDIEKWREWDIDWSTIDLVIGGSPCQGFTFAGKRLNFDDPRSKLFFVFVDALNFIKTKNPNVKFLLENVKMSKECKALIDDLLGVEGMMINSNLFSSQNRQRYYWTNIPIAPLPIENNIVIKDIINPEDDFNPKVFVSLEHYNAWQKSYKWKGDDINKKSKPLLATYYKQPPHCPYIPCENSTSGWRRLSPLECERLQTLPDNYTLIQYITKNGKIKENSYTQRWKCIGNGWTCKALSHIFKGLL